MRAITCQNLRLAECQESILKCTIFQKHLFSQRFSIPVLDALPGKQARGLIENAFRFATHKLTDMESRAQKLSRFGLSVYFN